MYKLVHNTFLGQIRLEHHDVREAPWCMLAPMLILAVIIFVTGMMPGLVLDWVASAQQAMGFTPVAHNLGGVVLASGGLDMIWVTLILFYGFAVGALIFYVLGGRSKHVHQYDNYAGGHFLTSKVRYHYSNHFYAGLMHLIGGWYRDIFAKLESALVSVVSFLSQLSENFYRTSQPAMMVAIVVVMALWYFVSGDTSLLSESSLSGEAFPAIVSNDVILSQGGLPQ